MPTTDELLVATVCANATPDVEANLASAAALVRQAAACGAQWVVLPEMVAYMGPYHRLPYLAEAKNCEFQDFFRSLAVEHTVTLFAGTIPELVEPGSPKVYNTCYVYAPDGRQLAKYRKTHLFNLFATSGEKLYCESDGFAYGEARASFDHEGWRVGLAICYDLRFPGLFAALTHDQPVDVAVLPSAFTHQTGGLHWELLLRARAVELQCYVVGSNQVGEHQPGKRSFGHSMLIDPWGTKIADTGAQPGVAFSHLRKDRIAQVRQQIPSLSDRRPHLYAC